ncbi:MAG: hypothetical protein WC254_03285 [Candidatus Woesearchaeota archaeon]|jgi:tRNA nucleotidyltransferase (CCA-adding enzyme)
MDAFDKVTATILKKNKVTHKEYTTILNKIDGFMHDLRKGLEMEKIEAYVMLGGSAAKGTFVKHDFDCDIFIRFMYDTYKDKDISELLEKALKKAAIKHERVHGSRDYFIGIWKNLHFEAIPVLFITNPAQAKNITDMSPLHVEWLNQHITEELRDQILLTKLFFKAQKIYGAESYMNGFSGHIVDILTTYYGTFKSLLENAIKWREKELINITPHLITASDLNPDKITSAIIVIDPIQKERNAAAAVGFEQFYHLKNQAAEFLEAPSLSHFKRKPVKLADIKNKGNTVIIIKALPLKGKLDTIGTKIYKVLEFIAEELQRNDFTVLEKGWDWPEDPDTEALLWIVVKEKELPIVKEQMGPPVKLQKDAVAFEEKHKKTFFKDERVYALVKRKYITPLSFVKHLLLDKRIKEKARKWKL